MDKPRVPILTKGNFPTWKIQMKMLLISQELFGYVNGTKTAPADQATAAYRTFVINRDKALAAIVLAVDSSLLYLLGDPVDPAVVWERINNTFQKKTWANKLRLRKKLHSMHLGPGVEMQQHIKTFVELFDELAVIGDAVEDEDMVINLLASLPDSYSTLVTALEASDAVPSWDIVTEKLYHEEQKVKRKSESESAMLGKKKGDKSNLKCFECGAKGHFKRQCSKFLAKIKKENNQANVASDNSGGNNNVTLLASAFIGKKGNAWVIDSGASQHMCNSKNSFCKLEKLEVPIPIEIGDGTVIDAVGIGKVSLKVNLPSRKSNCFLENVLYVPKLFCNLLSISKITESGKFTEFSETKCKIFSKTHSLLAIGDKIGKLYYLNCTEADSALSSVVSSDSSEFLWHRRFCHLGADNMRKLGENNLVKGMNCKFSNVSLECECCCDGRNHRKPFKSNSDKVIRKPFELIHSDVCGKITPGSLGGGNYFLTFIDECTKYSYLVVHIEDQG